MDPFSIQVPIFARVKLAEVAVCKHTWTSCFFFSGESLTVAVQILVAEVVTKMSLVKFWQLAVFIK